MTTKKQEKIKFSKAFWVANTVELFERAAYYGVFIVITLYLSRILGFNDIQAASIAGIFSACLYLLPTFAGALADKIGFRNSMLLAFTLLTCGYLGLAVYPTWLQSAGLVEYSTTTTFTGLLESNLQYGIIPIMALIVCGGAFIKSVISGTVAKETTPETRAKGFSIFYAMVNIGAFSGKTIVKPLREALGNEGLITLNYFSASMTFLALIAIWFFYKSTQHSGEGKTFGQIWNALIKVCSNGRLLILILIITGFWMVQHQLYATMPKYVLGRRGGLSFLVRQRKPAGRRAYGQSGHADDAEADSAHLHDGRYVYHAGVRPLHGIREYAGREYEYTGHASRSFHDGSRYCLPRAGGDVHFPSLPRVFLLASTQGRGRSLSWIQPFAFFPLLYLRIRAVWFPFKQVLPGANPVCLSRGMAGGKRERPLHLVLLRCDRLGIRRSVDRVRTSRKEAG